MSVEATRLTALDADTVRSAVAAACGLDVLERQQQQKKNQQMEKRRMRKQSCHASRGRGRGRGGGRFSPISGDHMGITEIIERARTGEFVTSVNSSFIANGEGGGVVNTLDEMSLTVKAGELSAVRESVRRGGADAVKLAFELVMPALRDARDCRIRFRALTVLDELFLRSKYFRSLVIPVLKGTVSRLVGLGRHALPPPDDVAALLRDRVVRILQRWQELHGHRHREISLAAAFVAHSVQQQPHLSRSPSSSGGPGRRRLSAAEARAHDQSLARVRFTNIQRDLDEVSSEITSVIEQMRTAFALLVPSFDDLMCANEGRDVRPNHLQHDSATQTTQPVSLDSQFDGRATFPRRENDFDSEDFGNADLENGGFFVEHNSEGGAAGQHRGIGGEVHVDDFKYGNTGAENAASSAGKAEADSEDEPSTAAAALFGPSGEIIIDSAVDSLETPRTAPIFETLRGLLKEVMNRFEPQLREWHDTLVFLEPTTEGFTATSVLPVGQHAVSDRSIAINQVELERILKRVIDMRQALVNVRTQCAALNVSIAFDEQHAHDNRPGASVPVGGDLIIEDDGVEMTVVDVSSSSAAATPSTEHISPASAPAYGNVTQTDHGRGRGYARGGNRGQDPRYSYRHVRPNRPRVPEGVKEFTPYFNQDVDDDSSCVAASTQADSKPKSASRRDLLRNAPFVPYFSGLAHWGDEEIVVPTTTGMHRFLGEGDGSKTMSVEALGTHLYAVPFRNRSQVRPKQADSSESPGAAKRKHGGTDEQRDQTRQESGARQGKDSSRLRLSRKISNSTGASRPDRES